MTWRAFKRLGTEQIGQRKERGSGVGDLSVVAAAAAAEEEEVTEPAEEGW